MDDLNTTTVVVAIISALGVGGLGREIFAGVGRLMRGVSLREGDRKLDLAGERDRAVTARIEADGRAERSQRNTWRALAHAAALERLLIINGLEPQIPPSPVLEDTLGPSQLSEIKGGKA